MHTGSDFVRHVRVVVSRIPKGHVMSYGDVAMSVGRPPSARAVGTILSKNNDAGVPCHRVVKSDGAIGGYNRLQHGSKERLLRQEGVLFTSSGKVVPDIFIRPKHKR